MKHIQVIQSFIEVLKNDSLFTADTLNDLSQLSKTIVSLTEEQYEDAANAIKSFCKKHPQVRDVVRSYVIPTKEIVGIPEKEPKPEDYEIINITLLRAAIDNRTENLRSESNKSDDKENKDES
jgi:hypothetical protein